MYFPHTSCRACGYASPGATGIKSNVNGRLIKVFDLGLQPLANDFVGPQEERAGYAPLQVLYCPRCTLGQLSVVVRPEVLYRRYSYVTSTSDMMRSHFGSIASVIKEETNGRNMLEIGSNDGRMLEFFSAYGWKVCGIDPAANLASIAESHGVHTVVGIFNKESATEAEREGPFDVVLARHVFCHVDNWRDFLNCLALVTHQESLVGIEAPYAGDMLARGEFDTIYHEHTSYLTLQAITAALTLSPFKLCRVEHFPIHGGALLLLLRRVDSRFQPHRSVASWMENESVDESSWRDFKLRSEDGIQAMKLFLQQCESEGKRVAGLGASAKSTVWITACGMSRKQLNFIADNTMQKHWTVSPGSDIPIVDEGAILRELPDFVICFAWNFREEVLAKNALARSKGVKFVFPIPTLEVV